MSFHNNYSTEQFNSFHLHRYLPGTKLPENIVAMPNLVESCQDAELLVFVLPHQVNTGIG
jgi:glycerol-3-phosphate dehydrogenase (NAD+)